MGVGKRREGGICQTKRIDSRGSRWMICWGLFLPPPPAPYYSILPLFLVIQRSVVLLLNWHSCHSLSQCLDTSGFGQTDEINTYPVLLSFHITPFTPPPRRFGVLLGNVRKGRCLACLLYCSRLIAHANLWHERGARGKEERRYVITRIFHTPKTQ